MDDKKLGYVNYGDMMMYDFGYKYYDWRTYGKAVGVNVNSEKEVEKYLQRIGFTKYLSLNDKLHSDRKRAAETANMARNYFGE